MKISPNKRKTVRNSYIIIIFCSFFIFVLSLIQISENFGFKNVITIFKNILDNMEKKYIYNCDNYISDIRSRIKFAKATIILNFLFYLFQFIYSVLRLKNLDKSCKIGILFCIIIYIGNCVSIIITLLAAISQEIDHYDKENYCIPKNNENLSFENEAFDEAKNISNLVRYLYIAIELLIYVICFTFIYLNCHTIAFDRDANKCIEKEFFCDWSIFNNIGDCCKRCQCQECCNKSGLTISANTLIEENINLKNNIRNLKDEIKDLKKQKDIDENNFNTERNKFKEEILIMKNRNKHNFKSGKNLDEENTILKKNNDNLGKEIEKLKYSRQIMNKDLEKMENRLIHENIELKQLNVIQFYISKKFTSGNYDKNNYIKNYFFKELKEIKNNYGLNIDSDKFKEICLYYIRSKFIGNLTDSKTKNIFTNPVLKQDGKTYEKDNLNKSDNFIENKLVLEICKILKESGEKLTFEGFQKIKKLLISKETSNYYKNPIVIALGVNKGETIEDIDNVIFGYKNKVIKNIIEDIRELLDDDFFKFEIVENEEMISKTTNNKTNAFNISEFEDV